MGLRRRGSVAAAMAIGAACLLSACQFAPAPTATPPAVNSPLAVPSPTQPTQTQTPAALDFTRPGAARVMINRLLADAGSKRLVMVEVTTNSVTVNVLPQGGSEPVTWAYRDGKEQQVASDLEYVDQAVFSIDDYDVSDVEALFSQAAALSGSTSSQSLHIVDFSGGQVVMAVTTNPESRTVFFEPDGTPLPQLNFDSMSGITRGLADVTGGRTTVQALGVESASGVWVDYPGPDNTTIRRQRTSKVPVTTTSREESLDLTEFLVSRVRPAAIWTVVADAIEDGQLAPDQEWSLTVDDRAAAGEPRMYFTFGMVTKVTDMEGREILNP